MDEASKPPALSLEGLSKNYGETRAVIEFSLRVAAGETVALLGPSGCGKSTVLRCVAGLEVPDGGRVLIGGQDVTGQPPERRGVGMVFQNYALFPHLSVLDNVAYGLRMNRTPKPEAQERAHAALKLVGLDHLAERWPEQLSGGQQQRIALARALAPGARLLLLDEPLSNLDEHLRTELRAELRQLLGRTGTAALMVTHDQREALAVAARVAVMRAGQRVQQGPAAELFARPATAWAAEFLGHQNIYPQPDGSALVIPEAAVTLGAGETIYPITAAQLTDSGQQVTLAHPLGPLSLHLSPREMRHVAPQGLRLSIDEGAALRLPDDRRIS